MLTSILHKMSNDTAFILNKNNCKPMLIIKLTLNMTYITSQMQMAWKSPLQTLTFCLGLTTPVKASENWMSKQIIVCDSGGTRARLSRGSSSAALAHF